MNTMQVRRETQASIEIQSNKQKNERMRNRKTNREIERERCDRRAGSKTETLDYITKYEITSRFRFEFKY